jgi:hypothetical protein
MQETPVAASILNNFGLWANKWLKFFKIKGILEIFRCAHLVPKGSWIHIVYPLFNSQLNITNNAQCKHGKKMDILLYTDKEV